MSIQAGLSIMDAYRNFMKEKETKNEVELVIDGELLTERKHVPNPKPEAEHGKKAFFRR